MGLKQLFKGIVIFSAIVLAMTSLNFSAEQATKLSLENGTIARFRSDASNRQLYLFFSSSCVHCENIMDDLQDGTTCSFNFNPIDRVEEFTFPGSVLSEEYDPSVNRGYLKHLDIRGVPVLLEKRADGVTLLRGETAISEFLVQYCTEPAQNEMSTLMGQISEQTTSAYPVATQPLEDGCSITEECEDQSSPYTAQ